MPSREPTHEPLDLDEAWDLSEAIEVQCPSGRVSAEDLKRIASDQDVPLSHVYAAAAADPELQWVTKTSHQVTVCAGSCQAYGACDLLTRLFAAQKARGDAFDVLTVGCLDRCDDPVAVETRSPNGVWIHPNLKPEDSAEILDALFG